MRIMNMWMLTLIALLVPGGLAMTAQAQETHYKVDPAWPKELPHNWILGHIEGITVDNQDHIWVLHQTRTVPADDAGLQQTPPTSKCCVAAPSVMEFDQEGNAMKAWGQTGWTSAWPVAVQGIWVDGDNNVWIGGVWAPVNSYVPQAEKPADGTAWDRQVLKFSNDGKLLLQIGYPSTEPIDNQKTDLLGGPCAIRVDDAAHEVYITDGHLNKRIIVYDSVTGKFKRGWGAYGIALKDIPNDKPWSYDPAAPTYDPNGKPEKQFRSLTDMTMSKDGMLYVADRNNDRVQVFTKQGKFVKEFLVAPRTLDQGSAWGVALSPDPQQKYLFVSDGAAGLVRILDRTSGQQVGTIGHKGRNVGQFDKPDWMTFDSKGNLYVGEIHYNNRVQKFVPGN